MKQSLSNADSTSPHRSEKHGKIKPVQTYTAVVEKCPQTGLFVGYLPGFIGAHSQGVTRDELHENLREVVAMLLEGGESQLETEFVGTELVAVG